MPLGAIEVAIARERRRNGDAQLAAAIAAQAAIGPLQLPAYNTFVRRNKKTRDMTERSWTAEQYSAELKKVIGEEKEISQQSLQEQRRLPVAGDIQLRSQNLTGSQLEDEFRRVVRVYTARFGYNTNDLFAEIFDGYPNINTSNRDEYRRKAMAQVSAAQNHTLTHFTEHIKTLVELSGGDEAWAAASKSERAALLRYLFEQAPATCTRAAFPQESEAMDIDGIFLSHISSRREKWQVIYRTKFIALALLVYKVRYNSPFATGSKEQKEADKELFSWLKWFMPTEAVHQLNLGPVQEVPAVASAAHGDIH